MSTLGKVLVVLVTVLIVVWIVLVSGVTELNKNWAKALEAQRKQVADVEAEVPVQQRRAVLFRDETTQLQVSTGETLALLNQRKVRLERDRSRALDTASRSKFQQERTEVIEQTAKLDSETRLKEREDMKKALAADQETVKKAQAENEELMAELARQRNLFRETFRANREKLRERARKISD